MDKDLKKELMRSDEDLAEAMSEMSLEESLEYLKKLTEMIASDPEVAATVPAEQLEQLKAATDKFESSVADAKIAERDVEIGDQNAALAQAEFDRLADELLTLPIDRKAH